jgi:hypothetical protein
LQTQDYWEKQNYVYGLPTLENLHKESFSILYFFFHHPPTGKHWWQPQFACAYIRVRDVSFAKFLFLPSWFFLILSKLDGCKVDLSKCWSFSQFTAWCKAYGASPSTQALRASPIVWASTRSKLMNLNEKRVQQLALNIVQRENSVLGIERAYLFSPS